MAAVLVIAFTATPGSGASGDTAVSPLAPHNQARESTASPRVAPEKCPVVQRALKWYMGRASYWQAKMGITGQASNRPFARQQKPGCPRYLARVWQRKAHQARLAYQRWFEYQYAWWRWLPDKWQRIGACETGYGKRPGNWRHSNSSYEGAFGFAKSSWDSFKYRADPEAGPYPEDAWQATPRQQYEVALAIWRAYGFSGWGCRNA